MVKFLFLSLVLEIESRGLDILRMCPAFLVHSKQLFFKKLAIQQVFSEGKVSLFGHVIGNNSLFDQVS